MVAKVISIVNQKGGVGKTTTSINLATCLASIDKNILLIDFDPQGNASTGLGFLEQNRNSNIYEVLSDKVSIADSINKTEIKNLDIIFSGMDLAAAEIEIAQSEEKHNILKNRIESILNLYDYILIDCPPSLGLLTLNAMKATTAILIALQCEFFALEGISHLLKTYQNVKDSINPALEIEGILLTMYDQRNNLTKEIENEIRTLMPNDVYKTVIPKDIKAAEAPSYGKPLIIYNFESRSAQAYIQLAQEFIKRNNIDI